MATTKVLIVDDQPYFRAGVAHVLSQEGDIEVEESDLSDNSAFLNKLEDLNPDAVLLGVGLSSDRTLELGKLIIRYFPTTRVVIMSPDPNDEELFKIIRTSAVACIKKDSNPENLISTLRRALHGEYPINDNVLTRPAIAKNVLNQFRQVTDEMPDELVARLTQQETHVLSRIAEGYSYKQIASARNINEQTIKNTVSGIMRKLNANDRTHAVVLAIRRGLIPLGNTTENLSS